MEGTNSRGVGVIRRSPPCLEQRRSKHAIQENLGRVHRAGRTGRRSGKSCPRGPLPCWLGDTEAGEDIVECEEGWPYIPDDVNMPYTVAVAVGGQAVAVAGALTGVAETCQALARIEITQLPQIGVPGKLRGVAWTQCVGTEGTTALDSAVRIDKIWITLELDRSPIVTDLPCENTNAAELSFECPTEEFEFVSGDEFRIKSRDRWQVANGADWVFHNPLEYSNRDMCWISTVGATANPQYRSCAADGAVVYIP